MIYALSGFAVVVITALLLWRCLPRSGVPSPIAKSLWAPYVSIVLEGGFAFGAAMVVAGVMDLIH